jgi:hypothetical protein|tara:strand:- start:3028 stop:3762 length:735 start_codon:yes stop_codon:yes gene_type:complete
MFSYNEFKNLINMVQQNLPIVDYKDVNDNTKKFCVLRHDIEFSIDRAYKLAKIEKELGVVSTYTVQVRNNTYNALSEKNIDLISKIKELGHHIGLHQNPPSSMKLDTLKDYIMRDITILEDCYGFEIDRFAFHRPKKEYLNCYVELDNRINCYDKKFFHFFEDKPESLEILYLADSNHKWKYGYPLDFDFSKINKLQLLTHPFSWSDNGGDNYGNFVTLIRERNDELVNSMNTETNTFPQELLS